MKKKLDLNILYFMIKPMGICVILFAQLNLFIFERKKITEMLSNILNL